MLGFAWFVLDLNAILLIVSIISAFLDRITGRILLQSIFVCTSQILGCLWYIFNLTILPYEFMIGIALGVIVYCLIGVLRVLVDEFNKYAFRYFVPKFISFIFFALAAIQHVWPHLITF